MYKYLGIALLGLFALMIIPVQASTSTGPNLYGMATVELHDSLGNNIFAENIHNRLVDEGENTLLKQVFEETSTTALADNVQFGSICLTAINGFLDTSEGETAANFTSNDNIATSLSCEDGSLAVITASGDTNKAVIGPLTFAAGTEVANGATVTGIGVCQNIAGSGNFDGCTAGGGGSGKLLAVVNTTDVILNSGETVNITYTFDLTSSTT